MAPPPGRPAPARGRPPGYIDEYGEGFPSYPEREYDSYDEDWDYETGQPVEQRPRRKSRRRRWIAAAVVVVLAGVGAGWYATRSLKPAPTWVASPTEEPTAVAPVLGELNADAPEPSVAGIAARLQALLADARLGGHVAASVVDVESGQPLFDKNGGSPMVPASTTKLLTAAAVLSARGPTYRIPTRVYQGSQPGEVVIYGGGDPTLAVGASGHYPGAARLDQLAAQVRKALGDTKPTRVVVDSSLFSGPTASPGWGTDDVTGGYTSSITPLMTDGGRTNPKATNEQTPRFPRPDVSAGQAFAAALKVGSIPVVVRDGAADVNSTPLAEVLSPPLANIVEVMLQNSDNTVAEMLARQVALAKGTSASFAGAADATRDALSQLGLPVEAYGLVDGSGLSYSDHVSAQLLTSALAAMASPEHPELRSILSGLPVAGYSGTLLSRYHSATTGGSAAGLVRAKTGTLSGVSTLAGVVVDADGRLLAFSIMADQVPAAGTTPAERALDKAAAAIAGCGCS
jgi:D-alanyl-D-alanine carboxypeptidase/D-alanyl-D-alanine-endopeptidase (penicillin-binding protein 4)